MGLELEEACLTWRTPPLVTDQQGMLSGEEKTRGLAIMQKHTIRVVGPDVPGAGGGLLGLVETPTNNRSTGDDVGGGKDQGACHHAEHHLEGKVWCIGSWGRLVQPGEKPPPITDQLRMLSGRKRPGASHHANWIHGE